VRGRVLGCAIKALYLGFCDRYAALCIGDNGDHDAVGVDNLLAFLLESADLLLEVDDLDRRALFLPVLVLDD
jgi:hypothetical protein